MADHIVASSRITTSVLSKYIRKRIEPIFRKSVFMGEMKSRGRISYGNGGKDLHWHPRFRRRTIVAGEGNPVGIDFPQTNTRREASLPWRQYQLGESITRMEKLVCQGTDVTLYNIAERVVNEMVDDFVEDFRLKFYIDGNASATNKDIHGLESMYSVNGCVTNSKAGAPNDYYGNLYTELGYYAGSWTADSGDGWPTGTGDTDYNAWSPLVVDYNNSAWTGDPTTWPNTWQEAIRYGTTYLSNLQRQEPDLLLLNAEMLREAKDSQEDLQRFQVGSTSGKKDLGFKTISFEGLDIATEYGVPDSVGYFLSFDEMSLKCMGKQLVEKDTDSDVVTLQDLIALSFFGNMMFEAPSYFGKLAAISAAGT